MSINYLEGPFGIAPYIEFKAHCIVFVLFLQAINGHFSMTHQYFGRDSDVTHENITVRQWKDKYKKRLGNSSQSLFAGFTYDAVWTYALALNKLYHLNESYLSDIHSPVPSEKYVKFIEETNFEGVSGRIQFLSSASRTANIDILQYVGGKFITVGTAYPKISETLKKVL